MFAVCFVSKNSMSEIILVIGFFVSPYTHGSHGTVSTWNVQVERTSIISVIYQQLRNTFFNLSIIINSFFCSAPQVAHISHVDWTYFFIFNLIHISTKAIRRLVVWWFGQSFGSVVCTSVAFLCHRKCCANVSITGSNQTCRLEIKPTDIDSDSKIGIRNWQIHHTVRDLVKTQ